MSEHRFSAWHVIGLVVAILGLTAVALSGGVFIGYQWGHMQALAEHPEQQTQALPWPPPNRRSFGGANNFPYLGVQFEMITPELAKAETLAADQGAIIRAVMPDSPAAQSGITVGDIIQQVDGQPVDSSHTLRDRIANHKVGDEITLTVLRAGQTLSVKVTLAAYSASPSFFPPNEFPSGHGFKFDFQCKPTGPCPFFPDPHHPLQRQPTY